MTFLSYDCALEERDRPPITVNVANPAERRLIEVSRLGHRFTLEVDPRTHDVFCIYNPAWGRQGSVTARIHVGTNARFH